MSVTVPGLSGLTNAYTSVLSATGSLDISGASRCDDMNASQKSQTTKGGGTAQRAARDRRAASCVSLTRAHVVPRNTSISPVAMSRTCTTICSDSLAGAGPALWVSAAERLLAAAGSAAPASAAVAMPATPTVAAPFRSERRECPGDSSSRSLDGDPAPLEPGMAIPSGGGDAPKPLRTNRSRLFGVNL